ncbi:hypothetical protein GYH30_037037 [Glycine max]|nr:hypothetical protein GYH30_037037 [Glycine max]
MLKAIAFITVPGMLLLVVGSLDVKRTILAVVVIVKTFLMLCLIVELLIFHRPWFTSFRSTRLIQSIWYLQFHFANP